MPNKALKTACFQCFFVFSGTLPFLGSQTGPQITLFLLHFPIGTETIISPLHNTSPNLQFLIEFHIHPLYNTINNNQLGSVFVWILQSWPTV